MRTIPINAGIPGTLYNVDRDRSHMDRTRFGMRASTAFVDGDDVDMVETFDESEIRDVFDDENVDNFNDSLSPVRDWRIMETKGWELPQSINVDSDLTSNDGNIVTPGEMNASNDTNKGSQTHQFQSRHQRIEKLLHSAKTTSSPPVISCNLANYESEKKERNLSLDMIFETNPLLANDEKRRRFSIEFTNSVSEESNYLKVANVSQKLVSHVNFRTIEQSSRVVHHACSPQAIADTDNLRRYTPAKMKRNRSLDVGFNIESLFTSEEEKRRANIAFSMLVSDELDTDDETEDTEQTFLSQIEFQRSEQLPNGLKNTSLEFDTSSKNLCEAMQKSIKTRTVVNDMNKVVFKSVPGLKEYIERSVSKGLKIQKNHSI